MKLYYSPGACSLSAHIALCEAGLTFELEQVDLKTHRTADGKDFYAINPKGYVPVLQLADGQVLTEGTAIVQFIADQSPGRNLAPAAGSFDRVRLQEWLNFISTEMHRGFSPLWNPKLPEATRAAAIEKLERWFGWLDGQLAEREYLMGKQFTVADGYLFTILNWSYFLKMSLDRWPALQQFVQRVKARPAVAAALAAEGLGG
jgi:glutathione S-transferase